MTPAHELQAQVQEARRLLQDQRTLAFGAALADLASRALTAYGEAFFAPSSVALLLARAEG
jgi:hypothetical protein